MIFSLHKSVQIHEKPLTYPLGLVKTNEIT